MQKLMLLSVFLFEFFFFFWACGIFPNRGSNLCPLHLEYGVLITREVLKYFFFYKEKVKNCSTTPKVTCDFDGQYID